MELNFCAFNQKKFLRRFKKIYESSVFLGRFKITGKYKDLIDNYEQMYKYLSTILKTPVIFENNNIYIVLAEIEGFLTAWDGFKETIHNVTSIDGLTERHQKFIELQNLVLNHLKEISEHPERRPEYLNHD